MNYNTQIPLGLEFSVKYDKPYYVTHDYTELLQGIEEKLDNIALLLEELIGSVNDGK